MECAFRSQVGLSLYRFVSVRRRRRLSLSAGCPSMSVGLSQVLTQHVQFVGGDCYGFTLLVIRAREGECLEAGRWRVAQPAFRFAQLAAHAFRPERVYAALQNAEEIVVVARENYY